VSAQGLLRRIAACAAFVALLAVLGTAAGQGLGLARESAVKAAFLYKFGNFVEWPADAFASPAAPLVIGVFGDEPVAAELEQITRGRTVQGRPVVVRRIRATDEIPQVHILFAGGARAAAVRELLAATRGPVLTVADVAGATAEAVLHFSQEDGRVRFEASLTAAKARGIRLGARLLEVAQAVEGR
jgi:hypothetical protein